MAEKWSKKEVEILKKNVNEPWEEIQKLLQDRKLSAIIGKKNKLKLRRRSSFWWSKEQERYLIDNYSETQIKELVRKLSKTRRAIHAKVKRLRRKGIHIKHKKDFLSKHWRSRYKSDKELIKKHQKAINKQWSNKDFRKRHRNAVKKMFKNKEFYRKHRESFIKRRNSKEFKIKQSRIASKVLKERHKDPEEHRKMLSNIRKNPSNQQMALVNHLREIFGHNNVGCNDWKILEGAMEVDVPLYPFKIALEWDGEYWHHEIEGVKERDERKNRALIKKGWSVIRVLASSHPPLSKEGLQERLDLTVGVITKILQDRRELV